MAVVMRFGHLADYAVQEMSGKLVLAGLFDIVFAAEPSVEVIPVGFTLVARLDCSIGDGLDHDIKIRVHDGEEDRVGEELPLGMVTFSPIGPGRPYSAHVLARFNAIQVRGVDDYRFVIVVDDRPVGEIPFFVQLAPQGAAGQ